ncbi:hypothetical protein AZ34_05760 [Hylemonella gracilis str. Niagara R]|uniref:Uncharacterized protein n=1 Tax=Hylemonella gracilis str. Niagara R TaxID=1458275 RepID=A0A016XLT8_9BURK|nr:hypothetical protein [Hylemonella gracilis]EYC52816.1 hypothetical protein AZ34_05760 [Hylemonella gracilis str. Niagara R]
MRFERLFFAVFGFFLRLGLLLLGLLVMVFVLALSLFMILGWGVYALVARLMGRSVQPLAFTILRQTQAQFFRRGARSDARDAGEVIDVNSREVDASPSDRLGR